MFRALVAGIAVLAFGLPAYSATIYVPDDYESIQEAIAASANGDIVVVRAGTYYERIDFLGKAITLQSEQGADVTIIDGNRLGSVVTFQTGESEGSVLDGFTVTNGDATEGGGIYCYYASPVIRNCRITNNKAGSGGGVHATVTTGGRLELWNCDISLNSTYAGSDGINPGDDGFPGGEGGAIHLVGGEMILTDCRLENNHTGRGGTGAHQEYGQAGDGGRGGMGSAIYMKSGTLSMVRCKIATNTGGEGGAGGTCCRPGSRGGDGGSGGTGTLYVASGTASLRSLEIVENATGKGGDAGGDPALSGVGGTGGTGGRGCGVYLAAGEVISVGSRIESNTCGHGGKGGVTDNGPGGDGGQGGTGSLYVAGGTFDLTDSIVNDNLAGDGGMGGEGTHSYGYGGRGGDGGDGGGIYSPGRTLSVVNCLVVHNNVGAGGPGGNSMHGPGPSGSAGHGGGVYGGNANSVIANATIAYDSMGIYSYNGGIKNCIVYFNDSSQISGSATVAFSDIQGGYSGDGNIDADPLFTSREPFGDYFLEQDPCQPGVTNPCVDGGNPVDPVITGTTRTDLIHDVGIVDMGYHYPGVIRVPVAFPTIQAAIDESVDENTILVAPGTYPESISFQGKAITVRSDANGDGVFEEQDLAPEATIIEGSGAVSVVTFDNSESADSVLAGFTITNGQRGIYCSGASPTVGSCIVSGNSAGAENGGGIYCTDSSPTIMNSIVAGNSTDGFGGGICCTNSDAVLLNLTVCANSASRGGGIYCHDSDPVVRNTILWGNQADQGAQIRKNQGSSPKVTYCIVEGGWTGKGNINEDPLLADPENGDYRLTLYSNAINMGSNSGAPEEDLDGNQRPAVATVDIGAYEFPGVHTLDASAFTVSESEGGIVQLSLNAGEGNAWREYRIYGSTSGTAPGIMLPGQLEIIHLTQDSFTGLVLKNTNTIVFQNFMGTLYSAGEGAATFNTWGPLPAGMAGRTFSFAYALTSPWWDMTSNPVNVDIVP